VKAITMTILFENENYKIFKIVNQKGSRMTSDFGKPSIVYIDKKNGLKIEYANLPEKIKEYLLINNLI
jgi:hypothetical protein